MGLRVPIVNYTFMNLLELKWYATSGSLMIEHGNSGGISNIVFPSAVNRGSDYGFITYQDASQLVAEENPLG